MQGIIHLVGCCKLCFSKNKIAKKSLINLFLNADDKRKLRWVLILRVEYFTVCPPHFFTSDFKVFEAVKEEIGPIKSFVILRSC